MFITRVVYITCIHYKSCLHNMNSLQEIYKATYSSYGPIQVHKMASHFKNKLKSQESCMSKSLLLVQV